MNNRNEAQSIIKKGAIEKALKDGRLEDAYREISSARIPSKVKQSQARKILEEVRKVRGENDVKKLKNSLVKVLLLLEYQSKRGLIDDVVKKSYEEILSSALDLANTSETKELGDNLYKLIEMLTIKFYERERSGR